MGFPPPQNLPPPDAGAEASLEFQPGPTASVCGFGLSIPRLKLGYRLPPIDFPPELPFPFFAWALTCDLSNPVDVTAGVAYGGGRVPNHDPDPDLAEDAA